MPELRDLNQDTIEWLTTAIRDAIGDGETVQPTPLLYLLRRYGATDREDLRDALGHALASAMACRTDEATDDAPLWLTLFAETSVISDDARLPIAASALVSTLRQGWVTATEVDRAARSVEACLHSSRIPSLDELVPAAIDELERVVGGTYKPGDGVGHVIGQPQVGRGRLSDQVSAASALLAGYLHSGRLPYSMLAEELMQFARRTLWDEQDGGFFEQADAIGGRVKPFALNCEAARVLCRLDALHRDTQYQNGAVVVEVADYAGDAARTLVSQTPNLHACGLGAAVYGLALDEWLSLQEPRDC
jgi:hypothetical protein